MGYSAADAAALGEMAQLRTMEDAGRAEAGSYPNRQVALRSFAAVSAAGTFTPAAPVAGPASVFASIVAIVDTAITKGKVELADILVTLLPTLKLAKAATALTGVAEVGNTVKTGQEALHAGATAMGAAAAVIERQENAADKPAGGNSTPAATKPPKPPERVCTGTRLC